MYFADHFMPHGAFAPEVDQSAPLDGDTLECWSVLAALAVAVPRLRLGSLVSSVTFRHPAVLANIAAAIDNFSGGRLVLGIGAGWQLNEHASYGIELGPLRERLDRFEEACEVITSLLRERRTTFVGDYYRVHDAPNQPPPRQRPLPLLIGGGGELRTMRIAARFADEWNFWSTPDVLAHKVRAVRPLRGVRARPDRASGVDTGPALHVDRREVGGRNTRADNRSQRSSARRPRSRTSSANTETPAPTSSSSPTPHLVP